MLTKLACPPYISRYVKLGARIVIQYIYIYMYPKILCWCSCMIWVRTIFVQPNLIPLFFLLTKLLGSRSSRITVEFHMNPRYLCRTSLAWPPKEVYDEIARKAKALKMDLAGTCRKIQEKYPQFVVKKTCEIYRNFLASDMFFQPIPIYQNSPPYDSSIPQDWSLVPMMRPPLELQELRALKLPFWMPFFVGQVVVFFLFLELVEIIFDDEDMDLM